MFKKFKSVSMLLALAGAVPGGIVYAAPVPDVNAVESTQQQSQCTGVVLDETGETVIGASVVVKGTTNGALTDMDGKFSLPNVKKGDVIQISFIGYQTVEVKWDGNPISVTLSGDEQMLDEVVVTGYGGVQKAKTMTASASVVKVEQLAKLPVTSMAEGLGGRVAGVITQQPSGAPGENIRIWIRGGEEILYVIDDVVMENDQGNEFFSRLRPDDIASMSVLKDAAATAVYGPRAKNGVVVIATKRGTEGAPTITFSQKLSAMTPSYRAKGMSSYEYAQARNEVEFATRQENPSYNNTEMSKYYMGDLWQKGYDRNSIMNMVNEKYGMNYTMDQINDLFDPFATQGGNIQDYYSTYDPWEMFDHVQPMYQTNLSLRGGGERIKYYSSLGYLKQEGISDSYDYEQINIILNTDAYLLEDKSLKFTFNLNGHTTNRNQPAIGDVFTRAMYGETMPWRPETWSTGLPKQGSPKSLLNNGFNDSEAYRFQMNAALKWNVPWVEGLSASASVNFTTTYNRDKKFSHDEEGVYGNPAATSTTSYNQNNATLYEYWYNYKLLTGIFQIDYNRSFGKHNLGVMANYQSQVRRENWSSHQKHGYPTTLAPQTDLGASMDSMGGSAKDWGSASYIFRLTYDYDNKYLFQYSGNYNGSLSYSPDKRWGYFQAVSLGWVMSEEGWFKRAINPKAISMLKIRGGFGLVGNEVGDPFSYLTSYTQNPTRLLFGANMASNVGWYVGQVASDLSWSSSKQMGLGLDFGFLNDRLTGSFDTFLYLNKGDEMNMTDDMIRTDILGMPNVPKINAPYVTNRKGGYEIQLNWQDRIGKVGYRLGLTLSHWDEITTRHSSTASDWYYDVWDTVGKRYMNEVYGFALKTDGLFGSWNEMYNSMLHSTRNKTVGTVKTVDINGDGQVNDYYCLNVAGDVPLTQYGVTVGADWNGFDLELFFQGAHQVTGAMPSPFRCQQSWMWNYGQYGFQNAYMPSNPDTDAALPIPVSESDGWGYNLIDRWAFDASYLKLKNISLRYDMKRHVLKNVSAIQAFELSFVVTNAFTWTKKSYPLKGLQDPEYITTGASIYNDNGTLGSYPTQRSYTFGLTITL